MDNNNKKNNKKAQRQQPNPLEATNELGKIGTDVANQMKKEARRLPEDFMKQLLGIKRQEQINVSGELRMGESLQMNEALSGKHKELAQERRQVQFEKRLLKEEEARVEKKTNELKIQLKVLQEELVTLAENTENLAEETQVAAMQSPVEPGVYHVVFFEKLISFIKSFRKKINDAKVWLQETNARARKKNRWGQNYKKHGAKYLLSGEHYLTRSAG